MFQRVKALMSDERDVFRVSLTHLVCGEKRMLNMLTYADVCMSCLVWICAGRSGCLAIATDGALLVRSHQRETVGGAIKSLEFNQN